MHEFAEEALKDWWADTAAEDADKVIPKAVEYGAGDLADIGYTMARITGLDAPDEAYAVELGIYFYVLGKMSRWTSAIERGEKASDDTLLDITTYLMMARRTRDVGGWPWASDEEPEESTAETVIHNKHITIGDPFGKRDPEQLALDLEPWLGGLGDTIAKALQNRRGDTE